MWTDPPAGNRLTAFARLAPSFLILGAQRSGTTSLYGYLGAHPEVLPAMRKEVHYFDFQHGKGRNWYLAHFPTSHPLRRRGVSTLTGEATPYYLVHPLAPARVQAFDAAMKLIAILRDPVERAWSHYRHEVSQGVEHLSFEAALDDESQRLRGAEQQLRTAPHYYSHAHHHFSYVDRGLYAKHLQAWLDRFPRRQLLILHSEDLFRDADRVANQVFSFLGLPPYRLPDEVVPHVRGLPPALAPALRARLERCFAADQRRLRELCGVRD